MHRSTSRIQCVIEQEGRQVQVICGVICGEELARNAKLLVIARASKAGEV